MNSFAKIMTTAALLATASFAQAAFDDVAVVKNVEPIYTEQMQQQQQQVCNGPAMQMADSRSNTGSVLGGIAGALLGSRIGNGNGRMAATAAGAALGAITGDRVDNRQTVGSGQQSCHWESVPGSSRVTSYLVTYEYQGHLFQSTMQYNPLQNGSNMIHVAVMATPR
ncbi:glycine zipper 2TM domain-containing protein [Rugamonas sp. A1-17]|nr:glycine zipper 2TM domain-containing protein [Rugamonas sp. A1-17]